MSILYWYVQKLPYESISKCSKSANISIIVFWKWFKLIWRKKILCWCLQVPSLLLTSWVPWEVGTLASTGWSRSPADAKPFFFFYNQFSKHEPKPKSKVINSQNIGLMAQLKIWKQSTDLDIHYLSLLAKYTTYVFLV